MDATQKKQTRLERRAKGLCPRCGDRPPEPGKAACRPCLDLVAANVRERRLGMPPVRGRKRPLSPEDAALCGEVIQEVLCHLAERLRMTVVARVANPAVAHRPLSVRLAESLAAAARAEAAALQGRQVSVT